MYLFVQVGGRSVFDVAVNELKREAPHGKPKSAATLARSFSPSGWASRPIAAGAMKIGRELLKPRIEVERSASVTSRRMRGRRRTKLKAVWFQFFARWRYRQLEVFSCMPFLSHSLSSSSAAEA